MFEGKIQGIEYAETGESPVLKQLRWTDLMARLAATRDMRAEMGQGEGDRTGSFAGFRSASGQKDDRPVNQDVLSQGKFARLDAANADDDEHGDRENT